MEKSTLFLHLIVEVSKNLTNEKMSISMTYVLCLLVEIGGVVYGENTPLLHKGRYEITRMCG